MGTQFEALASYFSVLATYEGVNECVDASISKSKQVASKHYLAFHDEGFLEDAVEEDMYYYDSSQWAYLDIWNPLEVSYDSDNLSWCDYQFKLYCKDFSDQEYKLWIDMEAELVADASIALQSYIHVDQYEGNLYVNLHKEDVIELSDKFTNDGSVYMDFRIVAFIAGSKMSGPGTAIDVLPHADI
jgi:hypothetical protein